MTREEQIEKVAEGHYPDGLVHCMGGCVDDSNIRSAFESGAAWADEHPNWHKGDDVPTEDIQCWCKMRNSQYHYELLTYNTYYNVWDSADGDDFAYHKEDVEAWLELPKFK